MKTMIPQGQMFIYFNPDLMDMPKVWVKVSPTNDDEPSLFIDNNAMVRYTLNQDSKPSIEERWLITDRFYGEMVRKGFFAPIDDLNEIENMCEQLGWPKYEHKF